MKTDIKTQMAAPTADETLAQLEAKYPLAAARGSAYSSNMQTDTETLGTALPKEIERCQELLEDYRAIGPVGIFAHTVINQHIKAAHKAMMENDCVAMLKAYEVLKGCK